MEPLLQNISTLIPNEKIDTELDFPYPQRGPRFQLKPSQMYRIHLLICLKRIPSFRQLQHDLFHHKSWRVFAGLKNKKRVPTLRAMSEFRQKAPGLLKQINSLYLQMILSLIPKPVKRIAVPDSTDIEAATQGYTKKTVLAPPLVLIRVPIRPPEQPKDTVLKNPANPSGSSATKNIPCAFSFCAPPRLDRFLP